MHGIVNANLQLYPLRILVSLMEISISQPTFSNIFDRLEFVNPCHKSPPHNYVHFEVSPWKNHAWLILKQSIRNLPGFQLHRSWFPPIKDDPGFDQSPFLFKHITIIQANKETQNSHINIKINPLILEILPDTHQQHFYPFGSPPQPRRQIPHRHPFNTIQQILLRPHC